ncbi:MAG: tryptophan synthase subunit alpha [Nitrososphaerota archaeon]|nr:tryptophan synthase subunit alpha [Nitrososphaerota archaeon]MDG6927349.1 tryptophan synthase subunit alpha [Nitrososphaerota archaeon]MDG6930923.1 tryptophan synthase subunit alpha [Nitrososphaerota archaeon]MDG6932223.1 tryptophan synthase subunit alpha [Nitrososphaerota archaeon]MDG6935784.1 tryptophan synthase subunit alpha [Nitrososphaerota archaeon]
MAELVIYNTVGFPDPETFINFVHEACTYVDALELGIPPRFAKYDGPTIRRSYAIAAGADYMNLIGKVRCRAVALTYLDGLDLEKFLDAARNVEAVLFPDLLIDHLDRLEEVTKTVRDRSLKNVIFISPSVPDAIIKSASRFADDFVYLGIRPATGVSTPVNVTGLVKRVRGMVDGKLIVGFGLKDDKEIAQAIDGGADGVAVGTSVMKVLEAQGEHEAIEKIKRLKEYVGSL